MGDIRIAQRFSIDRKDSIYFGLEKPTGGPDRFLRAFVDEMKDLIKKGFGFAGHHFEISKT